MQKKQPTTEQVLKALNEIIRENKTKLKTEKVELGLIDDLFTYAKKGGKQFDELAKLNNFAQKVEDNLRKEQQKLEEKLKEAEKANVMAKELGSDAAVKQVKDIEVLLKKTLTDTNKVIKIAQAAKKSSI